MSKVPQNAASSAGLSKFQMGVALFFIAAVLIMVGYALKNVSDDQRIYLIFTFLGILAIAGFIIEFRNNKVARLQKQQLTQ